MSQFVPTWAKGIVWYQIFPERFRNGDPSNDPRLIDQRNAWPLNQIAPFEIHPWTSDWYKRQPYESDNGLDLAQTLHRRRYGGDLQGVIDKLDYLQDLGVGALYLNPVFVAASEHKYDGALYHHVDPTFGPDPMGDWALLEAEIAQGDFHKPENWVWTAADKLLLELVAKLHEGNMRIILDGVWNHMGLNSPFFQDVVEKQRASAYADWFRINSFQDEAAGTKFEYEGWFGVETLPEILQDEDGTVAGPKQYIFDCTTRWMQPNGDVSAGIDGWRLDVAFCIEHPFWKDWRKHVRTLNPEGYLTAEVIRPISTTQPYLQGDEFDAVMNYNFAWAAAEWIYQQHNRATTAEFDQMLHDLIDEYPEGVAYVMQNLYNSHDSARIATNVVNRDTVNYRDWFSYHPHSQIKSNPDFDTRKPNSAESQLLKLLAILQFTWVGAPMLYYGEEVGMWSANDPDDRQPMVWPEFDYEPQIIKPDGTRYAEPQIVTFDHDLHAFYKRLIAIHNQSQALRLGTFETVLLAEDVYAFKRVYADETIIVLLNRSDKVQTVEISAETTPYHDLLNQDTHNNLQAVVMPPIWGRILQKA